MMHPVGVITSNLKPTLIFNPLPPSPGAGLKQQAGAIIPAPIQVHHLSPPTSLLPTISEVTGLNATLNMSGLFRNLGAVECSKVRCSGNGRCVESNGETACVCSLAYRGDSCQDHLLKTMQGPIGYAAAGLIAGVVVIIVIVVVAIRKRRANTRFVSSLMSKLLLHKIRRAQTFFNLDRSGLLPLYMPHSSRQTQY